MLVDLFVLQFTPEKAENPYVSSKSEVSKIKLFMGPVNSDSPCKNVTYKIAGSFHYEKKKSSFKKYRNRLSVYFIHIWWNGSQTLYGIDSLWNSHRCGKYKSI